MKKGWHKLALLLLWLPLPVIALKYWRVWDQLPLRMAVHFDVNNHPNGYTTKEGALELGLGIMGFMLVTSTIAALVAHALKPSASWPVLAISYIVLGFVCYGNNAIVAFNLKSQTQPASMMGSQVSGSYLET